MHLPPCEERKILTTIHPSTTTNGYPWALQESEERNCQMIFLHIMNQNGRHYEVFSPSKESESSLIRTCPAYWTTSKCRIWTSVRRPDSSACVVRRALPHRVSLACVARRTRTC
uniref:Uncharacterized protein n=1 Tax=Cacopsylla melanoneura TaxID=428564 RepID=A0A8D9B9R0_9HEMI